MNDMNVALSLEMAHQVSLVTCQPKSEIC